MAACMNRCLFPSCAYSRLQVRRGGTVVPAQNARLGFSSMRLQCNSSNLSSGVTATLEVENGAGAGDAEEAENWKVEEEDTEKALERLREYVQLNRGSWTGTFTQYDPQGNLLACVPVKMKGNVYGKGEYISLYQTLFVKQAQSSTAVTGDTSEAQWAEFNLADIDLVTMNQRHKVGYFGDAKAYSLSHLTARVIEVVLRTGLLGEDDVEDQQYFPGIKLPCKSPAVVCESCMFSASGNTRFRAYHVLNPQGVLDTLAVFQEHRDGTTPEENILKNEDVTKLDSLLGEWSGRAVTRRSGMYNSTTAEEDLNIKLVKKNENEIVQTITSTCKKADGAEETNKLVVNGSARGNLLQFTDGLQTTLLPGGMSMTCPIDIATCVKANRSFFVELAWIHSPAQRQRLIRTYDPNGGVVSSTLSLEHFLG